jgi:hypothetical protein
MAALAAVVFFLPSHLAVLRSLRAKLVRDDGLAWVITIER